MVVARGVDTQLFDPARRSEALRRQWGVAEGDGVVLYVGRLAAEKNLELLLQAFAAMRPINPRLRLAVNNAKSVSMPKDNIQRADRKSVV